MRNGLFSTFAVVMFCVSVVAAQAQFSAGMNPGSRSYAGFDALRWSVEQDGEVEGQGFRARLGSLYDETFAYEIQIGGSGSGTKNNSRVDLDLLYSVFF